MLSAGDAALVARDRALAGLEVLLDPERFVEVLREHVIAAGPLLAAATSVRYKPGMSCVVGYRVTVGDQETLLYARLHRPCDAAKAAKPLANAAHSQLGPGAIVLDDPCMSVVVFPNDHELRILRRCVDPSARPWLSRIVKDKVSLAGSTLATLRYKPERRFVGRLDGADGRRVLLKAHDRRSFSRMLACRQPMESEVGVRIPRRIGGSAYHRLEAHEWIEGEVLAGLLAEDSSLAAQAGAALARFHASVPGSQLVPEDVSTHRMIAVAMRAIGQIEPDLEREAEILGRAILERQAAPGRSPGFIHGDFSPDQVVVNSVGMAFIDLDRSGPGCVTDDLAAFAARLEYEAVLSRIDPACAGRWSEALIEGYETESGARVRADLAGAVAGRLLALASEPFRLREPDWPVRTRAVVERVREILHGIDVAIG